MAKNDPISDSTGKTQIPFETTMRVSENPIKYLSRHYVCQLSAVVQICRCQFFGRGFILTVGHFGQTRAALEPHHRRLVLAVSVHNIGVFVFQNLPMSRTLQNTTIEMYVNQICD